MDERPNVYFIPANITDNGNVLKGYFKKKNFLEAATIWSIGLVISVLLLGFLPLIVRASVFAIFFIIGFVALAGVNKEASLIEYVLERVFFKRKQRIMKYKLPRREVVKERKWKKSKAE